MKDPTHAKHCANSARAFQLASQRCFEQRQISSTQIEGLPVPAIVCTAFSVELGMKALLLSQGDKAWGHDLFELFNGLTQGAQDSIVVQVGLPRSEFDAKLRKIAKAFEQWRYVYEATKDVQIDAAFLSKFAVATINALPQKA
jgi:hypothetical protein